MKTILAFLEFIKLFVTVVIMGTTVIFDIVLMGLTIYFMVVITHYLIF